MSYTEELERRLIREQADVARSLEFQYRALVTEVSPKVKSENAREYLQHGVGRRMKIIRRSAERVFEIFPPNRTKLLSWDELDDIDINLHAFVINVSGVFDNLAWVYVHEHNLEMKIGGRQAVGLFKKETQEVLPQEIRTYLVSDRMKEWHSRYAKDYRDALAHRIPLYLPPSTIDAKNIDRYRELEKAQWAHLAQGKLKEHEQGKIELEALQSVCFFFSHSHSAAMKLYLHPQLIADSRTVLEVAALFHKHLCALPN